jgi:hypothetical protein
MRSAPGDSPKPTRNSTATWRQAAPTAMRTRSVCVQTRPARFTRGATVADPWTIKEDVEALINGVEASELLEPFREWVEAADEMARVLGLFAPQNDESARVRNAYWRARTREVPG